MEFRVAGPKAVVSATICVALVAAVVALFPGSREGSPRSSLQTATEQAPAISPMLANGAQQAAFQSPQGWTYLGPHNTGNQASSLAIRPDGVLYALSELGAVFRSVDAGAHWTFLSQLPMRNGKLEIAADQPNLMYAYESFYQDSSNEAATPYTSADGGLTWSQMHVDPNSPIQDGDLGAINNLKTVPGRPGVIFAATETAGLIRSGDGGGSWTTVIDENTNQPYTSCSGLEIATASNKAYTVCGYRPVVARTDGVGGGQMLLFDNVGDPWSTDEDNLQTKIAVSPSNPNVIYVSGTRSDQGSSRLITQVLRSNDGGITWNSQFQRGTSTNPFNIALPGQFERDCSNPQKILGFIDYQLVVDPSNPDVLWVGGWNIYRSDDGGVNFGRAGTLAGYDALLFAPGYNGTTNQVLYVSGGTGMQRTSNARSAVQTYPAATCTTPTVAPSTVAWSKLSDGYSAAKLVSGAVDSNLTWVTGGIGIGTWTGDDSSTRSKVSGEWGPVVPVAQGQVLLGFGGNPSLAGTAERRTWNAGLQKWDLEFLWLGDHSYWEFIAPVYREATDTYWVHRSLNIVQDVRDSRHLRAAVDLGAFDSLDGGKTWVSLSSAPSLVLAGFKRDGGLIATTSAGYFYSENPTGSGNWETRDLSGCLIVQGHQCAGGSAVIQELVQSPDPNSSDLYAVGNTYGEPKVFRSSNGREWQALDHPGQPGGLPKYLGMTTLAIDPDNPRHLYVGTAYGLYASFDQGQSWNEVNTPFPGTAVSKLVFKKDASGRRRLYAFTYGRGAWLWDVPASTAFNDVPTYNWAYTYIDKLLQAGITSGCATAPMRYCPEAQVTRDQMAVFLLRAKFGSSYVPPAASGVFADVPVSHWAAAWVERLRALGITSGCATNPLQYCPGSAVTRDQMAVFLLRAKHGANYQPPAATGVFADVPTSYWAAPWIEQLAQEGISSGCSATPKQYCPASPITRDQMAVFLVKAFGL